MLITFAGQGLNLVLLPLVLGIVGPTLYGTWAALATIVTVGALIDAGVRTEIARRVADANGKGRPDLAVRAVREGTGVLVAFVAPMVAAGFLLAPWIHRTVFAVQPSGVGGHELDWLIRSAFLLVAASVLSHAYFAALGGLQRTDLEMYGYAIGLPIGSITTLLAVNQGLGVWAFFLGMAVGLVAESVSHTFFLRRVLPELRFRPAAMSPRAARSVLVLSALALLSQVGEIIDSQWDKLVITRVLGAAAVTNFHLGTTLVRQARAFALLPMAPLLVAVAEFKGRGEDRRELVSLLSRTALSLASIVLPAAAIFATPFVRLWVGPGYEEAARAIQLFAVAAYLNVLSAPLACVAFGSGLHRLAGVSAGVNIVVNGVLSLVLTLAIGFDGALYGSIIGSAAGSLALAALFWRRAERPRRLLPVKAILLGLGSATVVGSLGLVPGQLSWLQLAGRGGLYLATVGAACLAVERLPILAVLRGAVAGKSAPEGPTPMLPAGPTLSS